MKKNKNIQRSVESGNPSVALPDDKYKIPQPPTIKKGRLEMTFQKFGIPDSDL